MSVTSDTSTELSVFACFTTMRVLRSMTDEQWASPAQIADATRLDESTAGTVLATLTEEGLVNRSGGCFRINREHVSQRCSHLSEWLG